jgi:fructose-1,6-bisphosphatase/inositol monophosphatase family enzyme
LVASGVIEAYQENNIAWWDVAAGIALVVAAGGKADYTFSNKEKNLLTILATNGKI